MKKILSILLAAFILGTGLINAGKDKDKKNKADDRTEIREERISAIVIKCPYCKYSQKVTCRLNAFYFNVCEACSNKMFIDTRGGLDYIDIGKM